MEQFLQSPTIVQIATDFRHQLLGNINAIAASFNTAIKNVAGMLLAGQASRAMLPNAGTTPQAQGTQDGGPELGCFALNPTRNVGRKFRNGNSLSHGHKRICVIIHTYLSIEKWPNTIRKPALPLTISRLATETSLSKTSRARHGGLYWS